MSAVFYQKGARSASALLGLTKQATETAVAPAKELPDWALPAAAGLGTAAVSAPLLYKYLRRYQPSANPALRKIQEVAERAGGKYTRGVPMEEPASKLQKLWDRISHTGSFTDNLVYTDRALPKSPKQVKGVARLSDPEDKAFVQGQRTVGASPEHARVTRRIGNSKMEEAAFFQKHAPGSMGKSESLKDVLGRLGHNEMPQDPAAQAAMLDQLQAHLKETYPQGFVMKDNAGYRSNGRFPSEEHNFNDLRRQFNEDRLPEMLASIRRGDIPEYEAIPKMTAYPSYSGRVLETMLKDPASAMVQEKIPIRQPAGLRKWVVDKLHNPRSSQYWRRSVQPSNEMRVHVEGGAAIPELTIPRYDPTMRFAEPGTMNRATEFAQNTVNQFPDKYKGMSFAMDVVPTTEGGFKIIESNPGGQSGFLYPDVMPTSGRWGDATAGAMSGAGATALGLGAAGATAALQPTLADHLKKPQKPVSPAPLGPKPSGTVQKQLLTPPVFNNQVA
jgi:hypothetical protein